MAIALSASLTLPGNAMQSAAGHATFTSFDVITKHELQARYQPASCTAWPGMAGQGQKQAVDRRVWLCNSCQILSSGSSKSSLEVLGLAKAQKLCVCRCAEMLAFTLNMFERLGGCLPLVACSCSFGKRSFAKRTAPQL